MSTEEEVRTHLGAIMHIEGGWAVLQDIIWKHQIIGQMKQVRKAEEIPLDEVAELMGVSGAHLAELEKQNLPEVDMTTIQRYAAVLDVLVPERVPA